MGICLHTDLCLTHELLCLPCLEIKHPCDCVSWWIGSHLAVDCFWRSGPFPTAGGKPRRLTQPLSSSRPIMKVSIRLGIYEESFCLREEVGSFNWPKRFNSKNPSTSSFTYSTIFSSKQVTCYPYFPGVPSDKVNDLLLEVTAGLPDSQLLYLPTLTTTIAYTASQYEGSWGRHCCLQLKYPVLNTVPVASNIVSVTSVFVM